MERIYTVPLRQGTMRAPRTRRAKKAILELRAFMQKHMKSDEIKVSEQLNEHMWQNGMRNPPMKVKVIAEKDDKGVVAVRMFGEEKKEAPKQVKRVEKATTPAEKIKQQVEMLKEAKEEKKTAKGEEAEKKLEKETIAKTPKAEDKTPANNINPKAEDDKRVEAEQANKKAE